MTKLFEFLISHKSSRQLSALSYQLFAQTAKLKADR